MANGEPRRHHYVPQFYLEYFAVQKAGSIAGFWVYDKGGRPPREATPLNTAVERDFYSLPRPDGSRDVTLETELFSRVEGQTRPILDKWKRAPHPLLRADLETVLLYLALQHVRVPASIRANMEFDERFAIEHMKRIGSQTTTIERMWKKLCADSKDTPWRNIEEFREHVVNFDKYYSLAANPKRALVLSLAQVETIHTELLKLTPRILITTVSTMFVTSDSPVNVIAPAGDGKAIFGAGFGLPNVEVVFPIGPFHALHLSREEEPGRFQITGRFAEELNRRCVLSAERYIFASYYSKRVIRFMDEFKGRFKKPRINAEAVAEVIQRAFPDSQSGPENVGA